MGRQWLEEGEELPVRVFRFAPGADSRPHWDSYRVAKLPQMTVLDVLFSIQAEQDDALSFRCSCRAGMCGTCGMTVNGRPRLTCSTSVSALGDHLEIAPLPNLPVIKDLVVDMEPFFRNYERIMPYLVPVDPDAEPAVVPPGSKERGIIDENLQCITCGLCFGGCGAVAADPAYLGPAALNRAYTLIADPRDAMREERMAIVADEKGIWRCRTQWACTEYCPKHLSPTHSIQQLRSRAARKRLFGGGAS